MNVTVNSLLAPSWTRVRISECPSDHTLAPPWLNVPPQDALESLCNGAMECTSLIAVTLTRIWAGRCISSANSLVLTRYRIIVTARWSSRGRRHVWRPMSCGSVRTSALDRTRCIKLATSLWQLLRKVSCRERESREARMIVDFIQCNSSPNSALSEWACMCACKRGKVGWRN